MPSGKPNPRPCASCAATFTPLASTVRECDDCALTGLREQGHDVLGWAEPAASGQRSVRLRCACGAEGATRPGKLRARGTPWECRPCAMRRRSQDPAWRAAHAEAMRRTAQDPAWQAANAESNRRTSQDPAWRAANAEANRRMAQDPAWRKANAERGRRRAQDPAWRKANAEAARRRAQDPAYRARLSEAHRRPEVVERRITAQDRTSRPNVVYLVAGGGIVKAGVSYHDALAGRLAQHRRDGLDEVLALFDVGRHYAAEADAVLALRSEWPPAEPGDTRNHTEAARVPAEDWPAVVDLVERVVLAAVPDAEALAEVPADSIPAAA